MERHYYGAYSYMGTGYEFSAPCWEAYDFRTKKERDEWVKENPSCKVAISRKAVKKIVGDLWDVEPDGLMVRL